MREFLIKDHIHTVYSITFFLLGKLGLALISHLQTKGKVSVLKKQARAAAIQAKDRACSAASAPGRITKHWRGVSRTGKDSKESAKKVRNGQILQ